MKLLWDILLFAVVIVVIVSFFNKQLDLDARLTRIEAHTEKIAGAVVHMREVPKSSEFTILNLQKGKQ